MVVCSHLFNELILSLGVGVVMWVNIALPVVDLAHSFIHSSFLLHLICCFAVSSDVGTSVCGSDAPFLLVCQHVRCQVCLRVLGSIEGLVPCHGQ